MSNELLRELRNEMRRENVALWLSPDWQPPTGPELARLAEQSWLGVWAESRRPELAAAMKHYAEETALARLVAEVPGRVQDVLGTAFGMAGIAPYLYLDGRAPDPVVADDFERTELRREKVALLRSLRSGVLLVAGNADLPPLSELGILYHGRELRRVVVTGLDEAGVRRLDEKYRDAVPRVQGLALPLDEALRRIAQLSEELPAEDRVKVGSHVVPLAPLLRTEPPIDQDFTVVTERDLQAPTPPPGVPETEMLQALLDDLLTGRVPPWKAIAQNDLLWPRKLVHADRVEQALGRLRRLGGPLVICLDLPAEAGSGVTVLLHELAFRTADGGYPTLVHRNRGEPVDYHLLRRFLTDLYVSEGLPANFLATEGGNWPAVLVFDAAAAESDAVGWLAELPERLAQDSRRALVVRVLPLAASANGGAPEPPPVPRPRRGAAVEFEMLPPLRADLPADERASLASWAARVLQRVGVSGPAQLRSLLLQFDSDHGRVPLLAALYYVLRDQVPSAKELARRLVQDLEKLPELAGTDASAGSEPLRGLAALERARQQLLAGFARGAPRGPHVDPDELRAAYVMLAAFGALNIPAPWDVLGATAAIDPRRLHDTVTLLNKNALAVVDEPVALGPDDPDADRDGRTAPAAFYTAAPTAALRHASFGRMILDWLAHAPPAERAPYEAIPVVRDLLAHASGAALAQSVPAELLKPLLQPLGLEQRVFVENLAMRFLRLQWRHRSVVDEWKRTHREEVYALVDWLHAAKGSLVRQSPSLLHTSAITAYKSCDGDAQPLPLDQARTRYGQAVDWLRRALELTQQSGLGEHPGILYTTLGFVFKSWGERERDDPDGDPAEAERHRRAALEYLRKGYDERDYNVYAAYGLANYLVDWCGELLAGGPAERAAEVGAYLAEAIELLQLTPQENFRADWQELFRRAVKLLDGPQAARMVHELIMRRDELGFALQALRELGNEIPQLPPVDDEQRLKYARAADLLAEAEKLVPRKPSELADLLRYALFVALLDPHGDPAYDRRLRLLRPLQKTRLLRNPLWMYDLALVAFQCGEYELAAEQFRQLRSGRRYQDVSPERVEFWSESPHSRKPRRGVLFQIRSISPDKEEGWGQITTPDIAYPPIKFLVRDLRSRLGAQAVQVGRTVPVRVRLDRAGPIVLADEPRRGAAS